MSDVALQRVVTALEQFIPSAEVSLRTGRRITDPDRAMTARGIRRRQTELAEARKALPIAQALLDARRSELARASVVVDVGQDETSRPTNVIDFVGWRQRRIERARTAV